MDPRGPCPVERGSQTIIPNGILSQEGSENAGTGLKVQLLSRRPFPQRISLQTLDQRISYGDSLLVLYNT